MKRGGEGQAGCSAGGGGGAAGCLASEGGGGGSGPCCCPVSEEASTGAARINIAAIRLCGLLVRNANSLAISLGLLASGHLLIGPRGTRRGLHANALTHSNYGAFRGGLQTAREEGLTAISGFRFRRCGARLPRQRLRHGDESEGRR